MLRVAYPCKWAEDSAESGPRCMRTEKHNVPEDADRAVGTSKTGNPYDGHAHFLPAV